MVTDMLRTIIKISPNYVRMSEGSRGNVLRKKVKCPLNRGGIKSKYFFLL